VASAAQADSEVPPAESELLGLIDDVHSRLANLEREIVGLNTQLAANQASYQAGAARLERSQSAAYFADRTLDSLEVEEAAARMSMRARAVAAYINQPTNDLANVLVAIRDPSQLIDAQDLYRDLVDTQLREIKAFNQLGEKAKVTARAAQVASNAAIAQQQAVVALGQALESLKTTLESVEASSVEQQSTQAQLLSQVGLDRAEFAAEVAAQAAETANIDELLAALSTPGATTVTPTAGYFAFPIPGAPITSPYGPRIDPIAGYEGFHPGVDFGAPMGTQIHAAGAGIVVFAGEESGYGNFTCINHGNNLATCYGHQSAILVQVGQQVTRGEVIGLVGSTGYSTGPHLHFEVRIDGKVTDPMPWLTGNPTPQS